MSSETLRGSEALCRLLRYLANQFLAHPGAGVKEYQVAAEVFGRTANFDPRLDSTVRVQTGRLRHKLAEYYETEGLHDALILQVPRGSYSLVVQERPSNESTAIEAVPVAVPIPATGRFRAVWVFSLVAAAALGAAGTLLFMRVAREDGSATRSRHATPALVNFWTPFLDPEDRPLVVFSNAEFVGHATTGLRYLDRARDGNAPMVDSYTGIGEVMAIHELDRVFALLGSGIRVKRGRLLTFDDAKDSDLIFIGSPSENLPLREISTTRDFVFRTIDGGSRAGDVEIVNAHPQEGEPEKFRAEPGPSPPVDFAVVALVPGLKQDRSTLILAGTTTLGTLAAVEFVCYEKNLTRLAERTGSFDRDHVRYFEAVIRARISGGVPVGSELMALHVSTSDPSR